MAVGCVVTSDPTVGGEWAVQADEDTVRAVIHTVQARALHAYLRRRDANARHRDVLAANARNAPAPAPAAGKALTGAGAPARQQPEPIRRTNAVTA